MMNLKRLTVISLLGLCASLTVAAQEIPTSAGDYAQSQTLANGVEYGYGLHLPKNVDKRKKMPLIVALHYGFGGEQAPVDYGYDFMSWMISPHFKDAIIVAPSALEQGWHNSNNTDALFALIAQLKAQYSIDDNRILLTGYSAGGFGTWAVGADHQEAFDAIMPISGAPRYMSPLDPSIETMEEAHEAMEAMPQPNVQWDIPVYVIHSKADVNVPIGITNSYIEQLKLEQPQADITYVTLEQAVHFDVDPFMVEAKVGYALINATWELELNDD
jgi:predicted peptidase